MLKKKNNLTKRQIKAQETKKKLLEAAIRLFAAHGYDQVTIEDITYNAGTSKGAFYSHFKSKQDVILERYRQQDMVYHDFYQKALSEETSSMERIISFLCSVTDHTMDALGIDLVRVAYINQVTEHRSEFFHDESRPPYVLLDSLIKQGQKKGEIREDLDSMFMVKMLTRLYSSWGYEWCVLNGSFNLTQEMKKHLQLVQSVLRPQ